MLTELNCLFICCNDFGLSYNTTNMAIRIDKDLKKV